jgi:hypothetical protein
VALRRPSWKRVCIGVVVVVGGVAAPVLLFAGEIAWKVRELFADPVYESVRNEVSLYRPLVTVDASSITLPLATTTLDGRDAGPYLNEMIPWLRGGAVVAAGSLPDVDEVLLPDFTWMGGLHSFSTWDIDTYDEVMRPSDTPLTRAMPDAEFLARWAKRRLADAKRDGDEEAARRDVEHLADLLGETESWALTAVGLKLLGFIYTREDEHLEIARRVLPAQMAWGSVVLGDELMQAAMDPRLGAFRCAGLNESLGQDLALRGLVGDQFPSEYATAERLLDESAQTCRLTWLRRRWRSADESGQLPAGPRVFCAALNEQRTGWCHLPDAAFFVPHVRQTIGHVLFAVALPEALARYRPHGFSSGYDPDEAAVGVLADQRRLLDAAEKLEPAKALERAAWAKENLHLDRTSAYARLEACGCRVKEGLGSTSVACSAAGRGASATTGDALYCPTLALGAADIVWTSWTFDLGARASSIEIVAAPFPDVTDIAHARRLPAIPSESLIADIELRGAAPGFLDEVRENADKIAQRIDVVELASSDALTSIDIGSIFRAWERQVRINDVGLAASLAGSVPLVDRFTITRDPDGKSVIARVRPLPAQEERVLKQVREIERVHVEVTREGEELVLRVAQVPETTPLRD